MSGRAPLSLNKAAGNGIVNVMHVREGAISKVETIVAQTVNITETLISTGDDPIDYSHVDAQVVSATDITVTVGFSMDQDTTAVIPAVLSLENTGMWYPFTVYMTVGPKNGAVTQIDINDGSVTYTPTPGYFGQDIYQYTVSDDLWTTRYVVQYININKV